MSRKDSLRGRRKQRCGPRADNSKPRRKKRPLDDSREAEVSPVCNTDSNSLTLSDGREGEPEAPGKRKLSTGKDPLRKKNALKGKRGTLGEKGCSQGKDAPERGKLSPALRQAE